MTLSIHPLTRDLWPAFENPFGHTGPCSRCWCMYWRIGSAYRQTAWQANKRALLRIVKRGPPPGLLAFDGDSAMGWCQLTPREAVPWLDRTWRLARVAEPAFIEVFETVFRHHVRT